MSSGEDFTNAANNLYDAAEKWQKVIRAIWVLIIGAFALGGWVATLEYRQRNNDRYIGEIDKITEVLSNFQTWRAGVDANSWSSRDQAKYAQQATDAHRTLVDQLQKQNHLQELRLQRLEDTQTRILETLSDIKDAVKKNGLR